MERDNRRLKVFAVGVLALAAALSTTGVIYSTRYAAQTVKAHVIDVVDNAGKVRVKLAVYNWKVASGERVESAAVTVFDTNGSPRAELGWAAGRLTVFILGAERCSAGLRLMASARRAGGTTGLSIGVPSSCEPQSTLADSRGFELNVGQTETIIVKTGENRQTSVASIGMFGNDEKHTVIWQAP